MATKYMVTEKSQKQGLEQIRLLNYEKGQIII